MEDVAAETPSNKYLSEKATSIVDRLSANVPFDKSSKYELEPYSTFYVEKPMPDQVSLGFYTEINGDLCPDPQVNLRRTGSTYSVICVDTMFMCHAGEDAGNIEYVEAFLDEMGRRYLEASS
jgi:hypothetical protein